MGKEAALGLIFVRQRAPAPSNLRGGVDVASWLMLQKGVELSVSSQEVADEDGHVYD